MRRFVVVLALVLGACSAVPAATPAPIATSGPKSLPPATAAPTPAATTANPTAVASLKAGDWPPEWQKWICMARGELLRQDAVQGGIAGLDASTQAIAYLRNAPNWEPGADFRALLGKAGFVMADAAPRGGDFLQDIVDANAAFEAAYEALKAATGFECPA
jgi:hypothetical protein